MYIFLDDKELERRPRACIRIDSSSWGKNCLLSSNIFKSCSLVKWKSFEYTILRGLNFNINVLFCLKIADAIVIKWLSGLVREYMTGCLTYTNDCKNYAISCKYTHAIYIGTLHICYNILYLCCMQKIFVNSSLRNKFQLICIICLMWN